MLRAASVLLLAIWLLGIAPIQPAGAGGLSRGTSAYAQGDYVRAAKELSPLARRGNARAQAMLGFMYEHGFGVPQAYEVAADLYMQAAQRGDPFAQCAIGLLYDKGHGVPENVELAYMWLSRATAHAPRRQRDYYQRLRDAVASKMTPGQIREGQRLSLMVY
ncbi:tetratricopeptide repeat protein [Bradyrhizobium prioriisuperbiae]|uniref:tetratricopeptide repeat protein n=1 Tax=Bradyrhizobium prioriisuperbiae TaxID=2854389 RepID=UPI00389919AA